MEAEHSKEHDKHTNKIALRPSILGLEDIVMSTGEANMFIRDSNYSLYHQPDDLMFDHNNWVIYNVEYKCTNHQRSKAIKQLHETAQVLRTMFRNYDVVNLYVHDDYQIERIS